MSYVQQLPADWEIAQLEVFVCVNHTQEGQDTPLGVEQWAPKPPNESLQKWYSCSAYLIRKEIAAEFLSKYMPGWPLKDLGFDFHDGNVESDHLLYKGRRTYSLPLVTITAKDTQVHPGKEMLRLHVASKEYIRCLWLLRLLEALGAAADDDTAR